MSQHPSIERAYQLAREAFAGIGVDAEAALARLDRIPISLHCWQGDDVRGFENPGGALTGGIQTTGNYPGRARTPDELRADAELAMAQIPGPKRFNLHAIYLDSERRVERNELRPEHFQRWVDWAKQIGVYEIMVRHTYDPAKKIQLLFQIAELQEIGGDDADAAFATYARALRDDARFEATHQQLDRLARGLGKRMREQAQTGARVDAAQAEAADRGVKAMIPIGRPFLDYVLSALADAGYTETCLVIGPEHGAIRE